MTQVKVALAFLMALFGCTAVPHGPLSEAAALGNVPRLKELISVGVDHEELNGALRWALRNGQLDAVKTVAAAGADLNGIDNGPNGWTPILHAIHKGQDQAALLLLDLGADVNAKSRGGLTALMMAAGYGNAKLVAELLDRGADPYVQNSHGESALSVAVTGVGDIDKFTLGSCQTETVRVLVSKVPDLKAKANVQWFTCNEVAALLKGGTLQ